ncbi:MAG: hypothetical protein B6U94_06385 [Thermofilum sp. ex4484_79]|nr:MAG: hypothetical protein B6U94_06385 [Thermofilum sp. ex4484_79]
MVSWGRSFIVALKILAVSFLWILLGLIIIVLPIIGSLGTVIGAIESGTPPSEVVDMLGGFIVLLSITGLIGGIIMTLGVNATYVKFIVDEAINEMRRTTAYAPPPYPT